MSRRKRRTARKKRKLRKKTENTIFSLHVFSFSLHGFSVFTARFWGVSLHVFCGSTTHFFLFTACFSWFHYTLFLFHCTFFAVSLHTFFFHCRFFCVPPTPPKPAQKWPPTPPYARKSLRSLPYGASSLPGSSKSTPYAYLSRRLCFKIVEIPSLRGHSKFLHAQNILQDRLLNFRHPKIFDMRHGLNLRRTKIFDMGYEKISRLDLSNFSDICDALKLCRDPTSPVEIELLLLLLKLKF